MLIRVTRAREIHGILCLRMLIIPVLVTARAPAVNRTRTYAARARAYTFVGDIDVIS